MKQGFVIFLQQSTVSGNVWAIRPAQDAEDANHIADGCTHIFYESLKSIENEMVSKPKMFDGQIGDLYKAVSGATTEAPATPANKPDLTGLKNDFATFRQMHKTMIETLNVMEAKMDSAIQDLSK